MVNQAIHGESPPPVRALKIRLGCELCHVSQAQIRHHRDGPWNAQDALECGMIKDAHPSDSDALRACREPQILDRAASTVEIGVPHRRTAEDMTAPASARACH